MPIFEVTHQTLKAVEPTTFGAEGIMERKDLQRFLRDQIGVLDPNLMVIDEEFSDWLDSSRRIDLLCLDSDAALVVVELKRTEDGGHMELQALRYAAMISAMTFEQLVETHARYKNKATPDLQAARDSILAFLQWEDVQEEKFPQSTRIVLASADFKKELTTTVMWLNDEYGLDIRCVRMKPYRMDNGTVLLDVDQLIPLPETEEFQTRIGVKKHAEQESFAERHLLRLKFWEGLLSHAKTKTQLHANRKPTKDTWLAGGSGRSGFSFTYVVTKHDSRVELWIAMGAGQIAKNKQAFKALEQQRTAIETSFGGPLDWQELPDGDGSRIQFEVPGGYRSPVEEWPTIQTALVDAMIRLDKALRARVAALVL